jgi:ethanolamine utilization protein EutQ (cupin superfamily)
MGKRVIDVDTVEREHAAGRRVLTAAPTSTIVTPSAWTRARELGVVIDTSAGASALRAAGGGGVERSADRSGVVVVQGGGVELERFAGAGAGKNVGLRDVITGGDRSPMTAGFMEYKRADAFAWTLTYDEIDLVLEGILHVHVDGRVVEAKAGDTVYIPKGSAIVFNTPNKVRLFYVTYPADWSGAKP